MMRVTGEGKGQGQRRMKLRVSCKVFCKELRGENPVLLLTEGHAGEKMAVRRVFSLHIPFSFKFSSI